MPLFVLVFLGIYGTMHFYLFWKVRAAFGPSHGVLILLAVFLAVMAAAPILTYILDRRGLHRPARLFGRAGFVWMALIFWFCALAAAADIWNLGVWAAALARPGAQALLLPPGLTLAAIACIAAACLGWGLCEAQDIRLHALPLKIANLPHELQGLTIAQVSDLHLGVNTGRRRLRRVVKLLRQANPDILVSTGDLVDSPLTNVRALAEELAAIQPRLGKFAVLGNHEYYLGLRASLEFHQAAGFRLLRAESVLLGAGCGLRLAGVDDPAGRATGQECLLDETAALGTRKDAAATILLKHQPVVREDSPAMFDLQLSGHTHGGQLFPFHLLTRLFYRHYRGLYELPRAARLFVCHGTGTWGPPVRLGAAPQVAIVRLEKT